MTTSYEIAIIGAGVFGSWTAYHLSRWGVSVCLIDAYGAGHSRASSGGESRIIRMGYGPNEIYTRWSKRALALWMELPARVEQPLFHRTGVLWMARENDPYAIATVETLQHAGIRFERLQRSDLENRFPQINFDQTTWAIYEPESGALMARRAVQTVLHETLKKGVEYFIGAIGPPSGSGRLSEVLTAGGQRISAGTFIFACGPWLPKLFPELLGRRIHPTRQEVFFFGAPAGNPRFSTPHMPTWIDFGSEIYGLPDLENRGFKIGLDRHGPTFDPDHGERKISEEMLNEVRSYMVHRFPDLKSAPLIESRVCQYENTSNGDFLIDRHPDFENVWLAGGGSGHGFKHGPALGEYLAEIIVNGGEIEQRFALDSKEIVRQRSVY